MITIDRLKKFFLLPLYILAFNPVLIAQDYDLAALQLKYPDRLGVILDHQQSVEIEVNKQGELEIYLTDYEEVLYLKESAKFYTEQSISLSYFFEDITEVEAVTYTASGKKLKQDDDSYRVVDSPPSSWVFHDDNKEMVFDLPELGEGYRSVISYTKKIKRPEFFEVFHFISGYPVLRSSVEINYPEGMELKFYERAMAGYKVERETVDGRRRSTTRKWVLNDLEAYIAEDGSTSIKNHIPHLVAQIQSYQFDDKTKELITDVSDLHKYFQEFLLLKGDESNRAELNKIVNNITDGMDDRIEKMDTIFRWVQANIKYIAFEDGINGYVPRSCSSVMRNRYGDCKDMGNLLVEMLSYAGIENAYVAWVGTRDIPYLMSEIPSPLTCNHVICVVEKPKEKQGKHKYYYLDATSPEASYLIPPKPIQEKELLIHYGMDQFDLYKVPAAAADKNYIKSIIKFSFTESDSLYGSGVDVYGGYERENRAYYITNLKDDDLRDYVKDLALGGANRYTLKDYGIEGLSHPNEELEIRYEFSVDNLGIKDGENIILNPTLFKPRVTKYDPEDYKYTRDKERRRTIDYSYEIELPANYKVKHLPENVHYNHDKFHFDAEFSLEGNLLTVKMKYQYHLIEIPVELFKDWNEFSTSINSATIQNIILEKI